jgi:hypothetical protein
MDDLFRMSIVKVGPEERGGDEIDQVVGNLVSEGIDFDAGVDQVNNVNNPILFFGRECPHKLSFLKLSCEPIIKSMGK